MRGFLTNNQIQYIICHLGDHFDLNEQIKNAFRFREDGSNTDAGPAIVFSLSEAPYQKAKILYLDGLPVLFPLSVVKSPFSVRGNSVVFHHDLLKSSFYLLSGYQERETVNRDGFNRFPYAGSLQQDLEIVKKPLVNYYFKMIMEGIEKFCEINGIQFIPKRNFKNFALFLSHDIDIVDSYSIYEVIYRLKQALGISSSSLPAAKRFRIALKYLFKYLNVVSRENPAWSFPSLFNNESSRGFRSTWFLLPKDSLHNDAYYRFSEKRIQQLIRQICDRNDEVGLHGTVRSYTDEQAMMDGLTRLQEYTPQPLHGIRQHRLLYDLNLTPRIQERAGFLYDATLGFAEHEGFRNSYCHPFRIYDHIADQMMDLWEIPLNVMDVTLFHYRKLKAGQAKDEVVSLLEEVQQFGGVFSFLWHNNFFDEDQYPGITGFYNEIHDTIAAFQPESYTGREIISRYISRHSE